MNLSADILRKFRYAFARKVGEVDPYNRVIGFDDLPGEIAASEFTVLFSGPPTVAMAKRDGGAALTPIGLVQQVSYNGQRNVTPVAELGNKSYRYIPGRMIHSANIGRILGRQGSLLYACYAWLDRFLGDEKVGLAIPPGDGVSLDYDQVGRHWTSLESDLFNIPTGFLLVVGNSNGEVLSRVYWEKCILPDYAFQIGANETTIMEQVSIKMSRAVPINDLKVSLTGSKDRVQSSFGTIPPAAQPATSTGPVRTDQPETGANNPQGITEGKPPF